MTGSDIHTDRRKNNIKFEIRLCPTLQNKPQQLPTTDTGPAEAIADDAAHLALQGNEKNKSDPFMPPYTPNLHVGDLQDADEQEYAVLVSRQSESLPVDIN